MISLREKTWNVRSDDNLRNCPMNNNFWIYIFIYPFWKETAENTFIFWFRQEQFGLHLFPCIRKRKGRCFIFMKYWCFVFLLCYKAYQHPEIEQYLNLVFWNSALLMFAEIQECGFSNEMNIIYLCIMVLIMIFIKYQTHFYESTDIGRGLKKNLPACTGRKM